MKTDYGKLGKTCVERLRSSTEETAAVQIRLLLDLIHHSRNTEYGRRYGFHAVSTPGEFQKKVPITGYGDYEGYISQILEGKKHVLTKEPAVYFCTSSGSVGEPKIVPITEADLNIQYVYAYGAVLGMVREHYGNLPETEVFGKIFQIGEFAKMYMDNGTMRGIRSSCIYQWLDRNSLFDASDYCVPKEVLFPDTLEDLLYVKVRFALDQPDIRAIHGVFINRVWGVMDYIRRKWNLLLEDMEQGKVHEYIPLGKKWREYVKENLPPNPVRARQLRSLFPEEPGAGMVEKIWPDMRYILAAGGKPFSCYMDRLKEYTGTIPIHYYAYAASEGIFGIARSVDEPDAYILFPEAGFFEFLPVTGGQKENGQPWFLWELSKGEKYELLFTNRSGLYRYRMGDVIEVVDWYNHAPVVRFCYRRSQVLNAAGEKTNQEQIEEAIERFAVKTGIRLAGYCVQEEMRGKVPGYLFYMECCQEECFSNAYGRSGVLAEEVLDECLSCANYQYRSRRTLGLIRSPRISYLQEGSFRRYESYLAARGIPRGQGKRVCVLDTADKKLFFASEQSV